VLLLLVQFVGCNTVQVLTAGNQGTLYGFMITMAMEQIFPKISDLLCPTQIRSVPRYCLDTASCLKLFDRIIRAQ
jgi:hypothetical protein